ncbi:MAG: DUF3106 domain-containing protein [Betaproteobacteria bacterium]|nr:DUF3106 domain-containing protein [Betaproteobacteria bacterium]
MARARFRLIFAVALWLASQPSHAVTAHPPPLPQPSWTQLNAEQKRALAPLAGEWDKMDGFSRKKWLGIAQRYPSLSPDEQARMQRRMTDWAKLTPEERKRAREKYQSLQKAPPERKEAVKLKWEQYNELPESEKSRLKAEAARKPPPRPTPTKPAVGATPPASGVPPSTTPVDQRTAR